MSTESTSPADAPLVAVVDIGKSNAKLFVIDAFSAEVVWSVSRTCSPIAGKPLRQLDIQGIEQWLIESLAKVPERLRIQFIVPIAHGAAAVLLDSDGAPLIAPDYEDSEFDSIAAEYAEQRDPFTSTYSPQLGQGLNLGRQLFYLQQRMPELFARCRQIVLYPQYWAYRLSGVAVSEITSLGCHTDLWDVEDADYSELAESMEWHLKFPTLRNASDVVGLLKPEIATRTGLNANCQVVCGLHDSNASYLCHLIDQSPSEPFAIVSSGTWTVVMARGIDLQRLRPNCDMLANVDAFGEPAGTARFMGGREYAIIAGEGHEQLNPAVEALHSLVSCNAQALPCFADMGGPFANIPGRLVGADHLNAMQRVSLATLYLALMSDLLLEMLDAKGSILIDGPLATNSLYCQVLATFRPQNAVRAVSRHSGPALAALYLAGYRLPSIQADIAKSLDLPQLLSYRSNWRKALPFNPAPSL